MSSEVYNPLDIHGDGTFVPTAFSSTLADFDELYPEGSSIDVYPELDVIPFGLPQDPEQQALCFFMNKFVLHDRREEIWGGSLETLPILYQETGANSALSLATAATSMSSIAWNPECAHFKPVSLQKYVKSLKLINDAVQDPTDSKTDNVLMAVLMLGFYEVRLPSRNQK